MATIEGAFILGIAIICPDAGHMTIEKMLMDRPTDYDTCEYMQLDDTMHMAFIDQLNLPKGCKRDLLCAQVNWDISDNAEDFK